MSFAGNHPDDAEWESGWGLHSDTDHLYDQMSPAQGGDVQELVPLSNRQTTGYTTRWENDATSAVEHEVISPQDQATTPTATWLPYSLRWQYLSGIIAFGFILEIIVVALHAVSSRDSGLVNDNGSGGIVVSSKFLPTALAVIYVLFLSILLDDIKRTEAFARLASPTGALAENSLTWTADAWWDAISGGFPTRSRKASWHMLCAAIVFMLGFLVVSPLSSTLIVSQDVVFTQDTQFARLDINSSLPLQANPLSATYFRSISNILRNVTTSAWLDDTYAILPVWPSSIGHAPLGPILSNDIQTWTAETTVFNTELECENLEFKSVGTTKLSSQFLANSTELGISVDLSSPSGCTINLRLENITAFASSGGAIWSTMDNTTAAFGGFGAYRSGITTTACAQDELAIFTTPLTNETYLLSNFTITGAACQAVYYVGNTMATVTLKDGESLVEIDPQQYLNARTPVVNHAVNMSAFNEVFFNLNWTVHVDAQKLSGGNVDGRFASGPANLLSALYNFSPEQLVADKSVTKNMQRIKQRFLGELFRDTFDSDSDQTPISVPGSVVTSVRRLVVVPAVAITLEVVMTLQLILLLVTFIYTRPKNRPLGLSADPAPAINLAKLIANEDGTLRRFVTLYEMTSKDLELELSHDRYQLTDGGIRLLSSTEGSTAAKKHHITPAKARRAARPKKILKFWALVVLLFILISLLVTIAVLYWYNNAYGLYQSAFVYAIDVSVRGIDLGLVSPASIITTLIAVCLALWWDSIDTTLRSIQPFLALAKEPVIGSKGVSVSYRSSYLLWAAFRAVKRSHWILVSVCTGAFLVEIFTVAMSSLWTRGPGTVSSTFQAARQLQLRHVPLTATGDLPQTPSSRDYRVGAISALFNNMRTSWIYGAAVQLSLNGPESTWSSGGWNFVPSDLSSIPRQKLQTIGNESAVLDVSVNVTLETQAIRGGLECTPYEFPTDTSAWLTEWDLTDGDYWNLTASPNIINHGYELGKRNDSFAKLPLPSVNEGRSGFNGDYTFFYVDETRLQCCQNITNGEIGQGSVGYWSFNRPPNGTYTDWPVNFTVKWIHGRPVQGYQTHGPAPSDDLPLHLIWAEKPQMTTLNCMPTVETANASVTVDAEDGRVIEFHLLDTPRADDFAWTDDFTIFQSEAALANESTYYDANLTISHGVLFVTGLLNAADVDNFGGTAITYSGGISRTLENIEDQTFNIRDPGLNVDLMTYSMLSLVNNDHSALLDPKTLESTAQKTFATLFQHFVNGNLSLSSGGYAYQSPNERLPDGFGDPREGAAYTRPPDPPPLSQTITLSISWPVELLWMSAPAAWICMLIIGYLVVTSLAVAIASREYNQMLPQQINSIADMAVLVAGSDKLLAMARERHVKSIKYDPGSTAKLGWFLSDYGIARWGIELTDKEFRPDSLLEHDIGNNLEQESKTHGQAARQGMVSGIVRILPWYRKWRG
ncbi:hypothetical protein F4677DRAFT_364391 [Hypoxylon crocopeplum]|nr:hypothetical protein F4677DRAFT_364391 [Hypoxylon crocopeplum]